MQCTVYLLQHKRAGAWSLLLPATNPPPKSWPDVTIQRVGHFETEVEAAEVMRQLLADDHAKA